MNRYSSSYTTNDNESECLISPVAKVRQSNEKIKVIGRGMMINRIIMVVLLLLFLLYTVLYTQSQISQISLQLEDITDRIHDIETIQAQHSSVIERFNSSITNNDIIDQLRTLEHNVTVTTHMLRSELKHTKEDIDTELTSTIHQLNRTVTAAENEIYDQVTRVKKDVEQYVLTTQDQFSMENSFMVYQLAGTFTVLSCLISMWHMTGHLRKLHQPTIQRKILAILWMSPIYAITSWFSLVFHSAAGYLAIIKDFYEAYVIYQFLSFCIAVIGKGDRNVVVELLAQDYNIQHLTPPIRFFTFCELLSCGRCCKAPKYESSKHLADAILLQCQLFAIQFVFFRPVTTTAMVILEKINYNGPIFVSQFTDNVALNHLYTPQFYITIIQNVSIFVAFTGLLKFYHAVDQELVWCRPLAKFLCIKGVVFMTFWQGLVLSILAQTTDLGSNNNNNSHNDEDSSIEWAKSAQNFLICLEMLLFSIAHFYCFPTEEWEDGYRVKHADGNFGDSIALGDFLADLKLILKTSGTKKNTGSKKNKKVPATTSSSTKIDRTILEGDDESIDNETSDIVSTISSINNNFDGSGGDEHDDHDDTIGTTTALSDNMITASTDTASRQIGRASLEPQDQIMIARALQESLGELANDPEIAEATKRLLDSKILTPSFFDYNGHGNDLDRDDIHGDKVHPTTSVPLDRRSSSSIDGTPNHSSLSSQIDNSEMDALISKFISTPPTEQSKLLDQQKHQASSLPYVEATPPLRPSIFTTIASIAESEDDPIR